MEDVGVSRKRIMVEEIRGLVSGKSEEQAEKLLKEKYGSVPDFWFDPLERSSVLGQDPAVTIIEGHINNFELSYGGENRLGESARGIGDLRNVAGQGMPGEEKWRLQAKPGK